MYKIPEKRTGCWECLVKMFKHQGILFLVCCAWPSFVVGVDFWMKAALRQDNGQIGLSPQFDVFMCD